MKRHLRQKKLFTRILEDDFEISRNKSGKPVCVQSSMDKKQSKTEISVSHDDFTLLCVAGNGLQGCDIEPLKPRTEKDWISLLTNERKPILDELVSKGESLDLAGTRVWTAIEAAWKAVNSKKVQLTFLKKQDSSILFTACTNGNNLTIMTFPVKLTLGKERIVALVVKG